jgi:hypothetical protein
MKVSMTSKVILKKLVEPPTQKPWTRAYQYLQINRLQEIFEGRFGYECKVYSITNLKKPQVELNLAIMNHVHEYDDPNNLLIFYYTGHGDVTGDDLELSA